MKAQKTSTNLALKMAIVERGRTQRDVAHEAGIGEVRLSKLIRGTGKPTDTEKADLARILGKRKSKLFPRQLPASEVQNEAQAS